jgi:hypothetical protein
MLRNYRLLGLNEILNSTKILLLLIFYSQMTYYIKIFSVAQEFNSGPDHLIVEISNLQEIGHPPSKTSLNE